MDSTTQQTYYKSRHRKVMIDRERGVVTKQWHINDMSYDEVSRITSVLNIVDPGRVIRFGVLQDVIYLEMHYVPGITVEEYYVRNMYSNYDDAIQMKMNAVKFWIDDVKRTFPYAHMDWSFANTVITTQQKYQLIDWDTARRSDMPTIRCCLLERLRSSIKDYKDDNNHPFVVSTLKQAGEYFDHLYTT